MNWKYFFQNVCQWIFNNKTIVFLGLLSFCLFVSTLAIAGQKRRLQHSYDELRNSLTSTTVKTPESTTVIDHEKSTTSVIETTTELSQKETTTETSQKETTEDNSDKESTTDIPTTEKNEKPDIPGSKSETVPSLMLSRIRTFSYVA